MNLKENILLLKSIAKKISSKLHCDRHGSCVHFAEIFVEEVNEQYPELLNDFDVIEGYVNVKFGDGIPQEHTWIRLKNDDIIDPTFLQFNKYDNNAEYSKKRAKVYSGQEYYDGGKEGSWFSERREKLPSTVFKEEKRESIRRIIREETNQNDGISVLLNEFGLYYVINYMGIKYDDVISKVGKLPREVKIQFLKDVVDDEKYYSPDGVNLSSGPLFINVLVQPHYYWGDDEEWSFDFIRKDPNDDTLLIIFAQWYDGGADFEELNEYEINDSVLEILVSELSEKIQQNKI